MKSPAIRLVVLTGLFAAVSTWPAEPKPSWNEKMKRLSATLSELMPELATDQAPSGKSLTRLKRGAKTLAEMAHGLEAQAQPGEGKAPDADPSLGLMAFVFEREAKAAHQALAGGHVAYGKAALRLVTSHCIACHTRTGGGPQFPVVAPSAKTAGLSRMDSAKLLTALRQYDGALEAFEGLISDPEFASRRQLEWGRAVRHAFAISVRVKQDPDRSLKIIRRIESLPTVPMLFKEFVSSWKKSIVEWKKNPPTPKSESDWFDLGKSLFEAAQKQQRFPMDHSADITYLRLSLVGHEFLGRFPKSEKAPEMLLLLGSAYDLLDDHLISPLPELYFETCIRRAPHTPIAQRCYQRYESNIFFGYTGSAGTSIPADVDKVRSELAALAVPKK